MTGLVVMVVLALLWGVVLAAAAERGVRRLSQRPVDVDPPPTSPRTSAGMTRTPASPARAAGGKTWVAAVPARDPGGVTWVAGSGSTRAGGGRRPGLAVVAGDRDTGGWWRQLRRQRERRWRDLQVVAQLPDVVDLLRLTTAAGLPVALALKVVGDRPGGPVGQAFRRATVRLRRGAALADVLPQLAATCGEPARSLVDALVDHERYGTPLGPALDRLAIESRLKRRRQAEEAARRLPVLLLFPLVFTTLPAFLLLAVVPLVAGSLSALGR